MVWPTARRGHPMALAIACVSFVALREQTDDHEARGGRTPTRPAALLHHHPRLDRRLWNYEVAVPVAGGWAVLEVVMNVPGDLAACVHPRFVRTDSGHRLPDRPL